MTTLALARPRRRRSLTQSRRTAAIFRHALLIFVSILILVPIGYTIIASFKNVPEFFSNPFGLPQTWEWQNYVRAWTEAKIAVTLPNSIIVTLTSVVLSTALSGLVAYGISRREKPLAMALYLLFISGMLVPVQMIVLQIGRAHV